MNIKSIFLFGIHSIQRLNSHCKAWSSFFEKFGLLCFLQTPVLRFPFCLITDKLQEKAPAGYISTISQRFRRGSQQSTKIPSYPFLQLIKYIQVAARSTSPDSSIPCKVVLQINRDKTATSGERKFKEPIKVLNSLEAVLALEKIKEHQSNLAPIQLLPQSRCVFTFTV